MGRPRTGSVASFIDEQGRRRFKVGITLPNGKRAFKRLPPGTSEARAHATAESWNEKAATDPALATSEIATGEAFGQWVDRWFQDQAARGIQTDVDRGRLSVHVLPAFGSKPVATISRNDIEAIVDALDRKVMAGEIKWKTASNVWGLITKAFDDAKNAKTRVLRVRDDNPAAGVRGPDRGERTLKQYLYPSEFLAVVSHEDVPLDWACIIAVAVYLYARPGELEALEWEDIDLERGIVHVHRAIDHEHGGTKATKTDMPRRFPIEPALLPLLATMHEEAGGKGLVLQLPSEGNLATGLRRKLAAAGVTRAELFAKGDRTRKAIMFYDLRATGITWRAVRGDDPLKIMAAAGHRGFATTQGYIREAEPLREGFGEVFPELPYRLLGEAYRSGNDPLSCKYAKLLCERRELNPHTLAGTGT